MCVFSSGFALSSRASESRHVLHTSGREGATKLPITLLLAQVALAARTLAEVAGSVQHLAAQDGPAAAGGAEHTHWAAPVHLIISLLLMLLLHAAGGLARRHALLVVLAPLALLTLLTLRTLMMALLTLLGLLGLLRVLLAHVALL